MTVPQRISVKVPTSPDPGADFDLEPCIRLFHRFIQAGRVEGLLIDVAESAESACSYFEVRGYRKHVNFAVDVSLQPPALCSGKKVSSTLYSVRKCLIHSHLLGMRTGFFALVGFVAAGLCRVV